MCSTISILFHSYIHLLLVKGYLLLQLSFMRQEKFNRKNAHIFPTCHQPVKKCKKICSTVVCLVVSPKYARAGQRTDTKTHSHVPRDRPTRRPMHPPMDWKPIVISCAGSCHADDAICLGICGVSVRSTTCKRLSDSLAALSLKCTLARPS